jgi:kynureninase
MVSVAVAGRRYAATGAGRPTAGGSINQEQMHFDPSIGHAQALDRTDPLRHLRARFHLPPGRIYLDGNSLGCLSVDAEASVQRVLAEWKTLAIDGWLAAEPAWFTLAEHLAAQIAPLIGAAPGELAIANSTTVNLHQLLATLYRPELPVRTKILAFAGEFPTDLYALQSHLRLRGRDPGQHLVLAPAGAGGLIDETELAQRLATDPTLQMAVLPAVVYSTGQLLDLANLTTAAHANDIRIGFDLSHSIGVVPHQLSNAGADFAFWCHYKYLNAGPGAVGGLYLRARHAAGAPGLAGWWGASKDRMFDLAPELTPAEGAAALQIGTPPILSLAALEGALALATEAGIERIRAKSLQMTDYLMSAIAAAVPVDTEFAFANPMEPARRGGHVALIHRESARICQALKAAGVIPDFRPPNIVRLAPAPLYNTFAECREAAQRLGTVLREQTYLEFSAERTLVT